MPLPASDLSAVAEGRPEPAERNSLERPTRFDTASTPGALILGGSHGALAVARSLGRRGVPVWVVGDHPIAGYSRYVRRRLGWGGAAPEAAVEMLCDLARNQGLAGWVLFPAGDAEVQIVSRHHARLAEHFRLFTMAWDTLQRLNDKSLLYPLAAEVGAAFPETIDPADAEAVARVHFPVVIKPASSETPNALTRAKAWLAETPEALERRYPEAIALMGPGNVVVQELVPGDGRAQFSYAGLWDRGHEVAAFTARRTRQFPIDFGMTSCFVETMPQPQVTDAARRILGGIGFHGLVEVEFKYGIRDDVYKVLDANTRSWSWIALAGAAGIDLPYLTWQLASGKPIDAAPAARPASWVFAARNILSIAEEYRRHGHVGLAAWKTLRGAPSSAIFAWDDPLPGLVDMPLELSRLWRRLRRPR